MPLHVKEAGSGKPVVLIHGLFGSLENVGGIARRLAENYHVLSVDLPNHGRSRHTDDTSLQEIAKTIYHWMQGQAFTKADFIGHSLGGKVVMELALTYPKVVDKLAVLDIAPVDYDPRHNAVFNGLLSLDVDTLDSRSEADQHLSEHVPEKAVRSFLLKNLVREQGRFKWRMNLHTLYRDYPNLLSGNRNACFDGQTLFLKGVHSDYIQARYEQDIVSRFPQAQVKVVADTGHWLHADKPDLVARLLRRFLS